MTRLFRAFVTAVAAVTLLVVPANGVLAMESQTCVYVSDVVRPCVQHP